MTELLAPAGSPDAGYAALEYGADAIYLGLPKFSARAEAVNFTPDQFNDLVGYAHTLGKKVYVTLNTLIKESELPEALEALETISYCQADAVIVQDFGILRIMQKYFPELSVHASTQMAIHNLAGAKMLSNLGVKRVTLARELALDEITDISKNSDIETESFLHGALCYSYSGLCMFSSLCRGGRSANRGRCNYSCREIYTDEATGKSGHIFSLKDMALPQYIDKLLASGVDSLKIEGRKKSPLYVASVVKMYRKLLDNPSSSYKKEAQDIQTVFSRPWTDFFIGVDGRTNSADSDIVGHRGTVAGKASQVKKHNNTNWLFFKTKVSIELHDGIQIDLPNSPKPYGFAVKELMVKKSATYKNAYTAEAGSEIQIAIPADAPMIEPDTIIYRSSSQELKRETEFFIPKAANFIRKFPIDIKCTLTADAFEVTAEVLDETGRYNTSTSCTQKGSFDKANNPDKISEGVAKSFSRCGDTIFILNNLDFVNTDLRFIQISELNNIRRDLYTQLMKQISNIRENICTNITEEEITALANDSSITTQKHNSSWNFKIDDINNLEILLQNKLLEKDIVFDLTFTDEETILGKIPALCSEKNIRLSLPAVIRRQEQTIFERISQRLIDYGFLNWQVSNLGGLHILKQSQNDAELSITASWQMYCINSQAIKFLESIGIMTCSASPEDDADNISEILSKVTHQLIIPTCTSIPLYTGESCPKAALFGCRNTSECANSRSVWIDKNGDRFILKSHDCRSYFLREYPFMKFDLVSSFKDNPKAILNADLCITEFACNELLETIDNLLNAEHPDKVAPLSGRQCML